MTGFKRTAAGWLGITVAVVLMLLVAAPVTRAVTPTGGWVYAGQFGSKGTGAGQFEFQAGGIVYDAATGMLYVADCNGCRIETWTTNGSYVTSWGSFGSGHGQFAVPMGLALAPDGDLAVASYNTGQVQQVTTAGTWQSEVDDQSGLEGVAVDAAGDTWVANIVYGDVAEYDGSGTLVTSFNGSASGTTFNEPDAVAVNAADQVFVGDEQNDRVVVFNAAGGYLRQWSSPEPAAITIDPAGNVFVGDASGGITEYNENGTTLAEFGDSYLTPNYGGCDGIAVDGKGHLWASADFGTQIVEFDQDKPAITTDADGDWHSQDTTVNFSATDTVSGIKELDYSTDGGTDWVQGDSVTIAAPTDHSNDGVHTVQVRATSNDGNATFATFRVKIDTQPPIVTGEGPFDEWMPGTSDFWFTASDVGSGVGAIYYTLDGGAPTPVGTDGMIAVSGEGPHTITYWATDDCVDTPNQSDVQGGDLTIDSVPPLVTTVNNVTVTHGKKASFRYIATDSLSPRCWVDLQIMKKGKLFRDLSVGWKNVKATAQTCTWTCKLAKGSYTWRATAYDMAGNQTFGRVKKLTVK